MTTDESNFLVSDESWAGARASMLLDPQVANLNTGSFGPLPRVVYERVADLRRQLAVEPTDFFVRRVPPALWEARRRLAAFIGAEPKCLIFTDNVSVAINLVAAGLTLSAPGEVLLTDHEYGAMHWCWERAAVRQGLALRVVSLPATPRDADEILATFLKEFRPGTRLVFFSHVISPTGLVLPAKEICAEARRRGIISVVDGAHAPVMIPLDVADVDADFYCGNGHKWLLAPTGAGFLYLGRNTLDRLTPLLVSWGYHHDRNQPDERDEFGSTPRLRALEFAGTHDVCPWLCVPAAVDFASGLGLDRIRRRNAHLAAYVRQQLDGRCGLKLATSPHPNLHAAMTAFRIPPTPLVWSEIRQRFWQRGIEVPIFERPGHLLLRVSTHFFNTSDEIDRLAEAVPGAITT